jgi:hypothetical protein
MATAAMKITVRDVTIDQLVDELQKFKYAGYGGCKAEFVSYATKFALSVIADRDLDAEAPKQQTGRGK